MELNQEDKRWSFQEEISKLFAASLKSSFPEFEQKPVIYASQEGQDGDYNWYVYIRFYFLSLLCNIYIYFFHLTARMYCGYGQK